MPVTAEFFDAERLRQSSADVIAHDDGVEKRRTAAARAFSHCKRRGHDAAAGMHEREIVRIVRFVRMTVHAVRERRHRR
jgi:hypothetical protein